MGEREISNIFEKKVQVQMDLGCMLVIVGNMILALKHPENIGPSSGIARRITIEFCQRLLDEGCPIRDDVWLEWE